MAMAVQANNLHSKMSGLVYKKLEKAEYLGTHYSIVKVQNFC